MTTARNAPAVAVLFASLLFTLSLPATAFASDRIALFNIDGSDLPKDLELAPTGLTRVLLARLNAAGQEVVQPELMLGDVMVLAECGGGFDGICAQKAGVLLGVGFILVGELRGERSKDVAKGKGAKGKGAKGKGAKGKGAKGKGAKGKGAKATSDATLVRAKITLWRVADAGVESEVNETYPATVAALTAAFEPIAEKLLGFLGTVAPDPGPGVPTVIDGPGKPGGVGPTPTAGTTAAPRPGLFLVVGLGVAIGGVALVGVSVPFFLRMRSINEDFEAVPRESAGDFAEALDLRRRGRTFGRATAVLFFGGATLAAAGGALAVLGLMQGKGSAKSGAAALDFGIVGGGPHVSLRVSFGEVLP